jgi:hypothetical protein
MPVRRGKAPKDGKIVKPEDKEWSKWFGTLSKDDHKKYLHKLGLSDDDLEEMDEVKKELHEAEATDDAKSD